jgi:hypothetical protein
MEEVCKAWPHAAAGVRLVEVRLEAAAVRDRSAWDID